MLEVVGLWRFRTSRYCSLLAHQSHTVLQNRWVSRLDQILDCGIGLSLQRHMATDQSKVIIMDAGGGIADLPAALPMQVYSPDSVAAHESALLQKLGRRILRPTDRQAGQERAARRRRERTWLGRRPRVRGQFGTALTARRFWKAL